MSPPHLVKSLIAAILRALNLYHHLAGLLAFARYSAGGEYVPRYRGLPGFACLINDTLIIFPILYIAGFSVIN